MKERRGTDRDPIGSASLENTHTDFSYIFLQGQPILVQEYKSLCK